MADQHKPDPRGSLPHYSSIQRIFGRNLQTKAAASKGSQDVHAAASEGVAGPAAQLPHLEQIQHAFGHHDVRHVDAHQDDRAAAGARAMGASAFAMGDHVAFDGRPSLHTAAHEAAHVVQQRGGVQLAGGVGTAGDRHEQHADAVADLVVQGKSAEAMLDQYAVVHADRSAVGTSRSASAASVQRKNLAQANLAGGLIDSGETRPIVGSTRGLVGRVFTVAGAETAADRTQALVIAAAQNAEIGKRLEGHSWQGAVDQLDQAKFKELDPFFLRVTVNFTHESVLHQLQLLYQHAAQFSGYVVAIKDSSNEALQQERPMDVPLRATDPLRDGFKYSNRHDRESSGGIAGLTAGTEEPNIDAYTKIAGEGGRWQCVRKFAAGIKNETRFFTTNLADEKTVFAIAFVKLWMNWRTGFQNKFDIPDPEVARALRPGGTLEVVRGPAIPLSVLTADDYDLDRGAGHRLIV